MRNEAYENVKITKNRVKVFHNKCIIRKVFFPGQKVLLYNSRLHLSSRKLKSRYTGSFIVKNVFPHGAIKTSNPKNKNDFQVNSQHLKPFFDLVPVNEMAMCLFDPVYR